MPCYAHNGDSGMDLFSTENYILKPGERHLFGIGWKFEIPEGYEGQIRPKSGLAIKYGISILNTPGTVDSSYRGELGVILINHGSENYNVEKGSKIAQLVFNKVERACLDEVVEVDITTRGEGGFGSTGLR